LQIRLPASVGYATIELKVSYLRPLPFDGERVEVRGTVQQIGRRIAFAEAHAYVGDRLVGHATSSLAALA
jgi:acyl-coenzyme A thioesterase PaaI-like protein